jgi:hypothetical protein
MVLARLISQPGVRVDVAPATRGIEEQPAAVAVTADEGAPPAGAAKTTEASASPLLVIGALVAVALATLIASWTRKGGDAAVFTSNVEGVTVFALFYVWAQALERLLEPIASIGPFATGPKKQERDVALAEASRAPDTPTQTEKLDAAAELQAKIEQWRANRAIVFWAVASIIALVVAARLKLYFLVAVGVPANSVPDWVHILVTAMVIAGGTKPLHDLITRIQQAKSSAQDPKEVGGIK